MKMENNQEHKIDRIFKKSLENQSVVPPTDAWMGIHTYTIGQEESKKNFWVKYVFLASLFLIFVGFGLWYFANNQDVIVKNNTELQSKNVLAGNGELLSVPSHTTADAVKLSVETRTTTQEIKPTPVLLAGNGERLFVKTQITTESSVEIQQTTQLLADNGERLSMKTKTTTQDNLTNRNIELIEPVSYLTDDKVEIIKSKPLILNNLIDKIQNENENKIVALEGDNTDKKEIYKPDTADYGGKFSLRHPIISYGFGMLWNFWDVERQIPLNGLVELPNRNGRGASLRLGIAWKVNKRLRMGVNMGINGLDAGIPSASIPLPITSSATGRLPIVKLISVYSDQFYKAETPFGNVNLPVSVFKDIPNFSINVLDEQKQLFYSNSHFMNTIQFSINSQYDILSKNRKKGKNYGYQLYGLLDGNLQRQINYNYTATTNYLIWMNGQWEQRFLEISLENKHLQNASELVFGLRAGVGFRYQFARKWDFHVEGSGQHSLNNWVKSDDIKTYQRAISLQAGINLNL